MTTTTAGRNLVDREELLTNAAPVGNRDTRREVSGAPFSPSGVQTASDTAAIRVTSERSRNIRSGKGQIDRALLQTASETVESINSDDPQSVTVGLGSLSGLIGELWRSGKDGSPYHRELLAALDNAVLTLLHVGKVAPSQLAALREALSDLSLRTLTEANVSSVASYFVDEGLSPLAPLGGLALSDDD